MKPKSFVKTLSIIHFALCAGPAIFASFAYMQNGSFYAVNGTDDVLIYLVPILAMIGYFGSKFVYQNLIRKLPKDESLIIKLPRYQMAVIMKYALLEAPTIFSFVIYLMTGNALPLVIGLSLLAYLFFQRPTITKLKNELPLNLQEEREFDTLNQ